MTIAESKMSDARYSIIISTRIHSHILAGSIRVQGLIDQKEKKSQKMRATSGKYDYMFIHPFT